MRWGLRILLAYLALALPAACDAPPESAPVGAAVVASPSPAQAPLPDAVKATVKALRVIAASGSVGDMVRLAEATPDFRSNTAGMGHRDYWTLKLRTGDWPMAHAERVLDMPYVVSNLRSGRVFIWPRLARLKPHEITLADAREIDQMLGEGAPAAMKSGEPWPGYVLAIAEDGRWLYFLSGAG